MADSAHMEEPDERLLSARERQELGLIEAGLRDDSRLVASLGSGGSRPLHRHPRIVWTAIVLGLVLTTVGPIVAAPAVTLQGLLLATVSYGWWRWKVRPTVEPARPTSRLDRRWWGFPPQP